jgi:hypothetical protein
MKRWKAKCAGWRICLAGAALCGGVFDVAGQGAYSVRIEQFAGEWSGTQAELVWTTEMEYETAGFRIVQVDNGVDIPLHDGFIFADIGSPEGGTYRLTVPGQTEDSSASFRLEELTRDGAIRSLGEWTVCFEEAEPVAFAKAAAVESSSEEAIAAAVLLSGPALKVPVLSNGLYSVSFAEIASGLDWTESAVSNAVETAGLAMRYGQEPVAYLADTNLQRIVFYGWKAASKYTLTNYFLIEPGSGLHMQKRAPEDTSVSTNLTYSETIDYEEEVRSRISHSDSPTNDYYYWKNFISGHATRSANSFDVPLEGYATNGVTFTVRLTGWNATTNDPDHQAEGTFNGVKMDDFFFDGKGDYSAVYTADGNDVTNVNIFTVKAIQINAPDPSYFVVDGFEVRYMRYYAPGSGLLVANSGGHGRLGADRFSDPLVLDVTDPFVPVWIADASGTIPAGWSWAAQTNSSWALCERSQVVAAVPQAGGFGAWMRDTTNAVDYLVIAPRDFETPAQELAEYRRSMGLRTAVAAYEDICDQFAGGLDTPEAIQACLTYACTNWAAAPWMVVLGGWGHFDYLNLETSTPIYLPVLLGSDYSFLSAADVLYADVFGADEVPDLAIGRLPVQSVDQFDDYITKLKAYEQAGAQPGHTNLLFAADNADSGGDFYATNLGLGDEAGARYACSYTTLDSGANIANAVRSDIRDAFTSGAGAIHYTGHGSVQSLADENIWDTDDVNALTNAAIPLFVSMTCLIGKFNHYSTRCLAETMVLHSESGALAVYSPSGESYNYMASQVGELFYSLHAGDGAETLGPTLLKARQSIGLLSGLDGAAIRTYNLLGDPALKLAGAEGGTPPAWMSSYAEWRWENFSCSELTNSAVSGAAADPAGRGWSNFEEYAFGGTPPRLAVSPATAETVSVSWNQRIAASDLEYRLSVSTNLLSGWLQSPPDMVFSNTVLSDGVAQRVDAFIPACTNALFIKLDVTEK